jgi:hypothetical protein
VICVSEHDNSCNEVGNGGSDVSGVYPQLNTFNDAGNGGSDVSFVCQQDKVCNDAGNGGSDVIPVPLHSNSIKLSGNEGSDVIVDKNCIFSLPVVFASSMCCKSFCSSSIISFFIFYNYILHKADKTRNAIA